MSWVNTGNFKYFASTGHSGFPAPSKWVGGCRSWRPECHPVCRHYSAQGGLLILFFLQSLREWGENATMLMTLPGCFSTVYSSNLTSSGDPTRHLNNIVPLFNKQNYSSQCCKPMYAYQSKWGTVQSITERPIQKSVKRSVRDRPPPSTKPQRMDFQVESSRSRLHVRTEGGLSFTFSLSLNGKKFHAQIHKGKCCFKHQRF